MDRLPAVIRLILTAARLGEASDALTALRVMIELRGDAEAALRAVVREARRQGATWEDIGRALSVTRQTAWERFRDEGR